MACYETVYCRECGNSYTVDTTQGPPIQHTCPSCTRHREDEAWHDELTKLRALTMQERLEKIERWIFEYRSPYRRVMF